MNAKRPEPSPPSMQGLWPDEGRPTSPPPPRRKPDAATQAVSVTLAEMAERNRWQQQQILLLSGQIGSLTERLGKYECPDCGSTEIRDRHHDGKTGPPECNWKSCDGCGNEFNHN